MKDLTGEMVISQKPVGSEGTSRGIARKYFLGKNSKCKEPVLVLYPSLINYNKPSDLKQHTCVLFHRSYRSEIWAQDDWVLCSGSCLAEIKVLAGLLYHVRLRVVSQLIQVGNRMQFFVVTISMSRLRFHFHVGCQLGAPLRNMPPAFTCRWLPPSLSWQQRTLQMSNFPYTLNF